MVDDDDDDGFVVVTAGTDHGNSDFSSPNSTGEVFVCSYQISWSL